MHFATWKNAILKDYVLYDSNNLTFWKGQNYEDSQRVMVFRGWVMVYLCPIFPKSTLPSIHIHLAQASHINKSLGFSRQLEKTINMFLVKEHTETKQPIQ